MSDLSLFAAWAQKAGCPTSEKADCLAEEFEERAAIMEYDGGMSRAEAERKARLDVYSTAEVA